MFSSDEQKPYFARLNTKESITAGQAHRLTWWQ